MTGPLRQPSIISQKVHLIQKLLLLENARNTVEQELRNLTSKAYGEVQGFLYSSCLVTDFIDLCKSLDLKCQLMQRLSALLKDFMLAPKVDLLPAVINEARTNHLQPLRLKKIMMTNVVKVGPKMKSPFMAGSIAKAAQELGDMLSLQQRIPHFTSRPAAGLQQDMTGTVSSNLESADLTTVSRCSSKTEKQQACDQSSQPDSGTAPPVITQRQEVRPERPQLPPPTQVVLPEVSNPKPMTTPPPISSGWEGDVQVQHQKQTSTQLLLYLKEKPKNVDPPKVFVMNWKKSPCSSRSPQSVSPVIKTQSSQVRPVGGDDLVDSLGPRKTQMNIENQAPVFRAKQVKSSASRTYQCVVTSETELWDLGDVLFDEGGGGSKPGPPADDGHHNVTAQVETSQWKNDMKTQTTECTEAKHKEILAEAKVQTFDKVNIPQFPIRRFAETEVVVSHIVDPGDFYVQQADFPEKLQCLIIDWKASSSYAEQNCIPDLGTLVMGWLPEQKQWCRAQVMKICGVSRDQIAKDGSSGEMSIQVEVKRLDHGDATCLSLRNLKELPPEMASLPLQAMQVSLANVKPVNGNHWSEESLAWFKAIVHDRTLYARFYPQEPKVAVELFLEKGSLGVMRRGASLSLRLAHHGHALHDKVKNAAAGTKNTLQHRSRKQESDWEKYLIQCYAHNKKFVHLWVLGFPLGIGIPSFWVNMYKV